MKPNTVFIALGTNLGDRESNLQSAIEALQKTVHLIAESNIYETAPYGYTDQADFLNQVIKVETHIAPNELLSLC